MNVEATLIYDKKYIYKGCFENGLKHGPGALVYTYSMGKVDANDLNPYRQKFVGRFRNNYPYDGHYTDTEGKIKEITEGKIEEKIVDTIDNRRQRFG